MTDITNMKLCMYESLASGSDLQQLVELAEKYLGNPIAVTTAKLEVLAFSTAFKTEDEIWNNVISGSSGRYALYQKLKTAGVLGELTRSPIIITDNFDLMPRRWIAGRMQYHGEHIGQILVMESEREFQKEDEEIILALSNICAFFIVSKKNASKNSDTQAESILMDIVSGRTIPEGMIRENLPLIPWHKNIQHRILILAPEPNSAYNLHPIKQHCQMLLNGSFGIVSGNRIILLDTWEENCPDPIDMTEFSVFLKEEKLIAVASCCFFSITVAFRHFSQTEKVFSCAAHLLDTGKLFKVFDFAPELVLNSLPETQILTDFYHDSIRAILKYDEMYHTNYLNDLYVYLSTDKNINKTADILRIHRNTVKYRIGKLEDLFELDLENPDEVFSLKFSFRIFQYNSKCRAPQLGARHNDS